MRPSSRTVRDGVQNDGYGRMMIMCDGRARKLDCYYHSDAAVTHCVAVENQPISTPDRVVVCSIHGSFNLPDCVAAVSAKFESFTRRVVSMEIGSFIA